ncbi:MAG: hypothetical protein Q8N81_01750 [bacterium]|nr:hypothetical protein [bacterium]
MNVKIYYLFAGIFFELFIIPAAQAVGKDIATTNSISPQLLASDPNFLKFDANAGKFKCLSFGTEKKEPCGPLKVVENPSYRGGVGLRVEAKTEAEARNKWSFSGYFYPGPQVRGKKLRLSLTVHMISGRAIFCQRPRQWDQGEDGKSIFLGSDERRQTCEEGETFRIEQIVPVKVKTNYMDYYFWLNASQPFTADIEAITIESVVDPTVKILPAADIIPAGTLIFRGIAELPPVLWENEAKCPETIILIFQDTEGKLVSKREIKAPKSPAKEEDVVIMTRQNIVLNLPPDLLPGGYAFTAIVKDKAGVERARDNIRVTVLDNYIPEKKHPAMLFRKIYNRILPLFFKNGGRKHE